MSAAYESTVLEAVLPNLKAEGFEVFLDPARTMLPAFMHPYRPDAIAIKRDKKLAIAVTSGGPSSQARLRHARERLSGHPDWELRVFYAPPRQPEETIQAVSLGTVVEALDGLLRIYDEAGPVPGLLTGWSVFEAAARLLVHHDVGRSPAAAQLLQDLASDGYITPEEADQLRRLAGLRSEAAHGRLDVAVTRNDMERLVEITQVMLRSVDPDETVASA